MVRTVPDVSFAQPVLHNGIVPHIVDAPGEIRWPGPAIGAHTAEVLQSLLGLDETAIVALRADGVIR